MIKVLFFGTPHFSVPPLRALCETSGVSVVGVVTQPDRPAGRGGKLKCSPIKEFALSKGIPVFQPPSIRKEIAAFLDSIASLLPIDINIVVAFGQILPLEVLNTPAAGSLNIHASLLPRWRGAAPIHRAILAGDSETGIALMRMEAGLDTGPVYSSSSLPIHGHTTTGELHDALAELGAQLLVRDIRKIVQGELTARAQSNDGVTYAAKITNEECEIQWSEPAVMIHRKVRAFSPSPTAFTELNGSRLKIYSASLGVQSPTERRSAPGTVITSDKGQIEVQCGEGSLLLDEVQLEGKKRLAAQEFLRGVSIPPSTMLGTRTS